MDQKAKKANETIIEGYDYLGNSASTTDCTGLIPREPLSKDERESYQDIFHYQPKASAGHADGRQD